MSFFTWRGGHLTGVLFLFIIGVIFAPAQGSVSAATFDVGCDVTELTTAIDAANSNGEDDIINLAAGCTYTLAATLVIEDDGALVINGNGASISGNSAVMVLEVEPGANLTLNNISIINGDGQYGGLENRQGTVVINNSTFSGNRGDAMGAIWSNGDLTINASTFINNEGGITGAIRADVIQGTGFLEINNSVFVNNRRILGQSTLLGGILTAGVSTTITNTTFYDNIGHPDWAVIATGFADSHQQHYCTKFRCGCRCAIWQHHGRDHQHDHSE